MEALTHVHPIVPLLLWGPMVAVLLYRSVAVHGLSGWILFGVAVAALWTWTFTEYFMHRVVFHYEAKSKIGKRIVYLFHGIHHEDPEDATRLVMPPAASILLALFFYALFRVLMGPVYSEPFLAFFIIGYLIYDYIHFATHHIRPRTSFGKVLKQNHMLN